MDKIKLYLPKLVTTLLVLAAAVTAYVLYQRYTDHPWTRDGQVRADIIKIAPRVPGYISDVAVRDNQSVKKGDLLFAIDSDDYQLAVDQAQVGLDESREKVAALEASVKAADAMVDQSRAAVSSAQGQVDAAKAGVKTAQAAINESEAGVKSAEAFITEIEARLEEAQRQADRARRLADKDAGSVEIAESKAAGVKAFAAQLESSKAGLQQALATLDRANAALGEAQAKLVIAENGLAEAQAAVLTAEADREQAAANLGATGDANVRVRQAQVALAEAQLKLSWTKIYAPADGVISNLYLKKGSFTNAGSPLIAFVDSNSFRVHAYFEETKLRHIRPGDAAVVTLMSHPDLKLVATVESLGRATNPPQVAATEGELGVVPQIQPTFDWVRLAQRVPVTIRLKDLPQEFQLVSGSTASVAIQPPSKE